MSFIGSLSTTLSESFISTSLNAVINFFKPVRYIIDDIFQFIFGTVKARNSRRFLFCLGFGVLIFKLFKAIYNSIPAMTHVFNHYYYKSIFNKQKFKERYGANCWALVTGFTDGLGYGYAQQLARLKYNLVLIGRNSKKIEYAVRWIKQIHPTIEVKVIELDFRIPPQKLYQEVYDKTSGIDVGIVVNNVGVAHGGYFLDISREKLLETYNINVNSQVQISKIFINRFKQRANRSAFINLSSCTGVFPSPRVGLYTFSKTYNDVFSRILTKQLHSHNIDVLTVRPFGVSTPMMGMKKGKLMLIQDL